VIVPQTTDDIRSAPTISGIQALRAFAATAVVVSHVQYDFVNRQTLPYALPACLGLLDAGVHLFFVISGFIMVYSSARLFGRPGASLEFLGRRIARIVPLYWTATTVMLGYDLVRGFAAADASSALVASSYFFIPYARPSGEMGPLFGVGWTLNYEMFFYLIFSAAIFASRCRAVCGIIAVLLLFSTIHALSDSLPLPFNFWFDPIILEFGLGMIIGVLYQAGVRLPATAGLLLVVMAAAGFFWTATPGHVVPPDWIGLGIPCVFAVSAAALTRRSLSFSVVDKLGDASYAIYLVHPMIVAFSRMLAQRGYLQPAAMPWAYLAGVVAVSIGAALIVHQYFEKPLTVSCRRFLLPAGSPAGQVTPSARSAW
jgi:exopolysaccharide production protein ExoZ